MTFEKFDKLARATLGMAMMTSLFGGIMASYCGIKFHNTGVEYFYCFFNGAMFAFLIRNDPSLL